MASDGMPHVQGVLMSPVRVQRKRIKGWRMPEGVVYVGRGTRWGNPYIFGETQVRMPSLDGGEWEHEGRLHKISGEKNFYCTGTDSQGMPVGVWHQIEDATVEQCVTLYREMVEGGGPHRDSQWNASAVAEIRATLAGKDLACWCPLDRPCHADVLLTLANGVSS